MTRNGEVNFGVSVVLFLSIVNVILNLTQMKHCALSFSDVYTDFVVRSNRILFTAMTTSSSFPR